MTLKRLVGVLSFLGLFCVLGSGFADGLGVLSPKGVIAHQERQLMFDTMALMLIVVLPVIIMSFAFAYRYRASKRIGKYRPNWSHNNLLEIFWWTIPTMIIVILGIIVWKKTHELDPYNEIDIPGKDEVVQVVALQWKWLFIYPEEGIATVNDLYMPQNKQVEFQITADAPMSAFDIPQLGGQIYAMAGMRTRLHYYSSHIGTYEGLNTQLNGIGFSEMHFPAHVVSQSDFDQWVRKMKASSTPLTLDTYKHLYEPTIAAPAQYFSSVPNDLFMSIMMQYMKSEHWLHSNA